MGCYREAGPPRPGSKQQPMQEPAHPGMLSTGLASTTHTERLRGVSPQSGSRPQPSSLSVNPVPPPRHLALGPPCWSPAVLSQPFSILTLVFRYSPAPGTFPWPLPLSWLVLEFPPGRPCTPCVGCRWELSVRIQLTKTLLGFGFHVAASPLGGTRGGTWGHCQVYRGLGFTTAKR